MGRLLGRGLISHPVKERLRRLEEIERVEQVRRASQAEREKMIISRRETVEQLVQPMTTGDGLVDVANKFFYQVAKTMIHPEETLDRMRERLNNLISLESYPDNWVTSMRLAQEFIKRAYSQIGVVGCMFYRIDSNNIRGYDKNIGSFTFVRPFIATSIPFSDYKDPGFGMSSLMIIDSKALLDGSLNPTIMIATPHYIDLGPSVHDIFTSVVTDKTAMALQRHGAFMGRAVCPVTRDEWGKFSSVSYNCVLRKYKVV